jgi:hypothetical protein
MWSSLSRKVPRQSSLLQLPIFTSIEMFRIGLYFDDESECTQGDKVAGVREIIAKTESGL